MTTRKPKQAMQDLQPKNTDDVKAGNGLTPAEAARGTLSPSQAAQPSGGTSRLGSALRPK